jgi:type IV pilus assembly protein PilB
MPIDNKQLKAFVEDSGLVKAKDLEEAVAIANKKKEPLGDVLVEQKLLSSEKLAELKAYISGISFVDLTKEKIDPDVLKIIPEPIARKHNIVAYKRDSNKLEVATTDTGNLQIIDFIRKKAGLKILTRLTTEESIQHVLKQYEESLEKEFAGLMRTESVEDELEVEKESEKEAKDEKALQKAAEDLPTIRIVDSILRHAINQRASDIHIEPEEKDVVVRYRIDGILHDTMTLPKQVQAGIVARIKVLSNLRLDEHRLPQDGRFATKTDEYKVSFRVSVMPVFDGEKVVMRLLRENVKGYTLEGLGFRSDALEKLTRAIHKSLGMILATGPTGSGKTTTLYTLMDLINSPEVNISTVEDPIEYRMPRINQTQVRPDIGLTFANGLRSLVRQDPDVIMVGEIRDSETASLAINAALTGHLVLSTLHTNSAAGALPRLIDMEQEPFLIASTVNIIIAQRLVRRLCPETRKKYHLTKKEIDTLSKDVNLDRMLKILKDTKSVSAEATWETIDFYKPVSSDDCPDGYKDRIGIHEVLEISESIRKMITENATSKELEERAKQEGMITMLEDGVITAALGITSLEEVFRVTSE